MERRQNVQRLPKHHGLPLPLFCSLALFGWFTPYFAKLFLQVITFLDLEKVVTLFVVCIWSPKWINVGVLNGWKKSLSLPSSLNHPFHFTLILPTYVWAMCTCVHVYVYAFLHTHSNSLFGRHSFWEPRISACVKGNAKQIYVVLRPSIRCGEAQAGPAVCVFLLVSREPLFHFFPLGEEENLWF